MPIMYGVQRSEKYKRQDISGIEKEATRTAGHYNNDVDSTRSQHNISLINSCDWIQKINNTIQETGVKIRKDSVMAIGSIYTATGGFFQKRADESKQEYSKRIVGYFKDCLQWHKKTYCHDDESLILSAVIHLDETTPHMHIYSIPIIERDGKYALSAKAIMGNKKAYTERVDSFYNEVSKKYGLERGEPTIDGQVAKKHIETQRHKLSKLKQDLFEAKAELTSIESDKIMADFEKQDLQNDIKYQEITKQNSLEELNKIQNQLQNLENQIRDKQKRLSDLNTKTNKCIRENTELQKEIKQQAATITKQKQDIQRYDEIKSSLAELQDWLSYDTYIHSVIEKMPNFYEGKMPDVLKRQHEKYYAENIEPIADYANYLIDQITINEQYIDDEEIEL